MRLVKFFSVLLIILISNKCFSQVVDDFSDGDFTINPSWIGDDSLFQINNLGQLQSKGSVSTSKDIYLSTPSNCLKATEWSFLIRFNLNPSTQNFCRFYISSDSCNLKASNNNAYYIQFGGITGNNDSIQFIKQVGTNRTVLIGGRRATVSKSNNVVRMKILRDSIGNWQMFSDTLVFDDYTLEGTVFDSTLQSAKYLGFWVKYTSTNASNYYLDDVYSGSIRTDLDPPILLSTKIISDTQIYLTFNERLESQSALDTFNYILNNNIGKPSTITFDLDDVNSLILTFIKPFTNGERYVLSVTNIKDRYNNRMPSTNIDILYYFPIEHDILISELFPDPSPIVGLPDAEFIEIYNHSQFPICLNNWSVSDPSTTTYLPDITIKSDSFIILCSSSNEVKYNKFGTTLGLNPFTSLNNDGDTLILRDDKGNVIHELKYNISWYKNQSKKDGGWTLEIINPKSLCLEGDNWQASLDAIGGTPGTINSNFINIHDDTKPIIKSIEALDSIHVLLIFSNKMDKPSLQLSQVKLNGVSVTSKQIFGAKNDSMVVGISTPMFRDNEYVLDIDTLENCLGNLAFQKSISLVYIPIISEVKQNDIVISEVFANPKALGQLPDAEWIELYNRSKNIIRLKNWKLKKGQSIYSFPNFVVYPDSFVVVCDDKNTQNLAAITNVVSLPTFPSLSSDDELTILSENNFIIHQVAYKNEWMNDKIKQAGGWSLELIDVNNPCTGNGNWAASINAKGATPGSKNSVAKYNPDKTAAKLLRAYPIDNKTLALIFNEALDSVSTRSYYHYKFNNQNLEILNHNFIDNSQSRLAIKMVDSFQTNMTYRIVIDNVYDCAMNVSNERNYADFALPKKAELNDIHINEVLFNPISNGSDFVELYNSSDKFIDLKDYLLCNTDDRDSINDFVAFGNDYWQIHPNQYMIISDNASNIISNYRVNFSNQIIDVKTMPAFSDNSGTVLLTDLNGNRIEKFAYDDKMHFPLLDNKEGVSLERISTFKPVNDRSNWTSASATVGYATPTYRNSQYLGSSQSNETINIQPEVFSPDGDGYNDMISFNYQFSEPGNIATLQIFNSNGVLTKTLLKNELLGGSGTYNWNGIDDKGSVPAYGIYIAIFEVYNLQGETQTYRKTFVLGGKL